MNFFGPPGKRLPCFDGKISEEVFECRQRWFAFAKILQYDLRHGKAESIVRILHFGYGDLETAVKHLTNAIKFSEGKGRVFTGQFKKQSHLYFIDPRGLKKSVYHRENTDRWELRSLSFVSYILYIKNESEPLFPPKGEGPQGEHPLDPHLFQHLFLKREVFFNQPFEEQLHFWGAFAAGAKAMNVAA
jgi:hypothetical protein